MKQSGSVDQHGLLVNVLTDGLLLNFSSSITEFTDNSIDGGSLSTDINLNKTDTHYNLIICDDGKGMNIKDLKNFITLCKQNTDASKNGKYGLGAKAALVNITNSNITDGLNHYSLILSCYYDDTKQKLIYKEIEIDWNKINNDSNNENVWSDNVNYENMSLENAEYFKSLNENTGVIIKTFISKDYFVDVEKDIKALLYNLKKTYNFESKLNPKFEIKFTTNIESIDNDTINSENTLDFIHYDDIKSKSNSIINIDTYPIKNIEILSIYADVTVFYNTETKFFRSICNETNLYNYENESIFNKNYDNNSENEISFKYRIVWIDKELLDSDTSITKEYLDSSSSSWNAGLYFIRNNRVLSKPISLKKIRTSQSHTKWRAAMIFDNDNILSEMIKIGVNKSEINSDSVNKILYNYLSSITSPLVDKCVGLISSTYKCKQCKRIKNKNEPNHCECCSKCKMENCECCDKCNKLKKDCKCCKQCRSFKNDCECCIKCNNLKENCSCCSNCKKISTKCKCCKICRSSKKTCKCCKKCNNLKQNCSCCDICNNIYCDCCKQCNNIKSNCNCCDICKKTAINCNCYSICIKCNNQNINCKCCQKCKRICDVCDNPQCNQKKCDLICTCKHINGNWQTIDDNIMYKDGTKDEYDIVYLIQPSEHWNTNIYKIGRTTQNINKSNTINRFTNCSDYKDYLKQILLLEVKNGKTAEKKLIKEFKSNFQIYNRTNEYFIGDLKEMKRIFLNIILNEL